MNSNLNCPRTPYTRAYFNGWFLLLTRILQGYSRVIKVVNILSGFQKRLHYWDSHNNIRPMDRNFLVRTAIRSIIPMNRYLLESGRSRRITSMDS